MIARLHLKTPRAHAGIVAMTTSAAIHGFTVNQLRAKRGGKQIERTRIAAMWATRQAIGHLSYGSYPALGRVFDRNHTTILHSVKKGDLLRATDASFAAMSNAILESLTKAHDAHARTLPGVNPAQAKDVPHAY